MFGLVQMFTVGKLHFWVFPNLDNEKCGFFESFKPFYSVEWKKDKTKKKKTSTKDETEGDKEGNGRQEDIEPTDVRGDGEEKTNGESDNSQEKTGSEKLKVEV